MTKPEQHAPVPLSWKAKNVNAQVAKVGWKPLNKKMIFRLAMCAFYAASYGYTYGTRTDWFYAWPLEDGNGTVVSMDHNPTMNIDNTNVVVEVVLEGFLTNGKEVYTCDNRTYFLNETGPIPNLVNDAGCDMSIEEDMAAGILYVIVPLIGVMIFFFILFIMIKLYFGKYNQLLGLIKFKEFKNRGTHEVSWKPDKFSFAFSIMCNAKSFTNVALTEDECKSNGGD